jgi:hypothetical protein
VLTTSGAHLGGCLLHESSLCVDQKLVEFDFLEFLLFDHEFNGLLLKLLSQALILLFQVHFHLFLLCCEQLVDLKLTVELLLKVLDHVTHLPDVVLEFIVLDFNLGELSLVLFIGLFLFLHFGLV